MTGEKPLATFWHQATPGTTHWRTEIPARHLPGQSLSLLWTDLAEDADGAVIVPRQQGDTAIWQFLGNATRALIAAHQQEQGVRVLMEVDDNYLVPAPHIPAVKSQWQKKIDRSESDQYSHPAHRKICRWVDGIIVSTPLLAEHYSPFNEVFVCPNSVDLEDWPAIEKTDRQMSVGYAGSDSHLYDLALIDRALDWASHQGVTLWKIGTAIKPWRWEHQTLPWTDDLAVYRKNLQVLDVGLCPLKRGTWADCKSDIKAIEYVLSGALPIVQDAPPYEDWKDVVPVADTPKDWLRHVQWAVQHPSEVEQMAKQALRFVMDTKLIERHIDSWRQACSI